jgi:RNA polymerase sigma-70 factor (ECF subfamily)
MSELYKNLDDHELVARLRSREEGAFVYVVGRYQASLLRVVSAFVSSRAVAEEVVQETWLHVVAGLDRFEGRSSLKTWIFRIASNRARTRGQRERRSTPFSAMGSEPDTSGVDATQFDETGHWKRAPADWKIESAERLVMNRQAMTALRAAIDQLPANQRVVVVMRDVEGLSSDDVCNVLDITETHQRVLLHRARTQLRAALELYFERG